MLLCHTKEYVDQIYSSASMSENQIKELSSKFDGVYFHNVSKEGKPKYCIDNKCV